MSKISIARLLTVAGSTLAAASFFANAQTTSVWQAAVAGNWNDGTKWSTNPTFPNNNGANTFNATIAATGAPYIVTLNTPITIENMSLTSPDATLALQGSNTLTLNQALTFTGSRISGNAVAGALSINGAATMQGVTFTNMDDVNFNGGANFSGAAADDLNDTCVVHHGIGGWAGTCNINLNGSSGFMLQQGSTFTISSNANLTWNHAGSMAMLSNSGTLIKTSSGTTNITDVMVGNHGTLDVRAGQLSTNGVMLTGGNLSEGIWKVSGGANLDLIGTSITTNGADVTVDGATSAFGALSTLATNSATGKLTFSGGKAFTTAGDFTNNGTATVGTGSMLTVLAGSSLTNFNAGTHTLTGGVFNINGVLKFDNTGISVIDTSITLNGAAAQIQTGTGTNALAGANRITTNGKLSIKGNKTFTTAANFKVDGTNSGVLEIESGSEFVVPAGSSLDNYTAGTKTLSEGDFRVAGKLTFDNVGVEHLNSKLMLDGATAQVVDGANTDALTGLKSVDATGALTLANNADLTTNPALMPAFVFTVAVGGKVKVDEGSHFDIHGDLANYNAGQLTDGVFDVKGRLRANNITSIFTVSTNLALASATANITNFNNDDVFSTINLITATGNFRASGGRLLTLVDASGLVNHGTFSVGFSDPGDTTVVNINHNYTQSSDSGISPSTVVQNGAALNVGGNFTMNTSGGMSAGNVAVTGSHLHVSGSFIQNSGTVAINTMGLITVGGSYDQTGGELSLTGGELAAAGGYHQTGGTLSGDGVINGNMVHDGIIAPGHGPGFSPGGTAGRIFVTGSVMLDQHAVVQIDLGEPVPGGVNGYDQLQIGGLLNFVNGMGGILMLNCTVQPHPGDVFIPITYGEINGRFSDIQGLQISSTMYLDPVFGPHGIAFIAVQVPGAASLAPLGAFGLLAMRRRRK